MTASDSLAPEGDKRGKKKNKEKDKSTARSTETLFRNAVRSNLDLTSIADNKANIMISVNGFILTVIVTAGGFVMQSEPALIYPFTMILLTAILSIGCAVMAVKPKVNLPEDTLEDLRSDKSSIIYFRHYVHMNPDDYVREMKRVLNDAETIHTHIARHIYGLGYGLSIKFRWLRFSYTIFTIGLASSALVFVLAMAHVLPASVLP
ncbi:MAG: DUF5706 domain-containing protein [Chromatiales bacterium]|jgi:hypothetical protein